jgi:hypothetical protein
MTDNTRRKVASERLEKEIARRRGGMSENE